ncbi:MAG: bile acid:sodium symporter family protein [Pelagibacteraceae bacterium]|jgi:BASS family bile acid:Na+ symporter|nr:bile acid:sodium symporter family protein [Pelagibacteraceae bacterium]MBT4952326.1 bile acid:sodium symporter family protein [Pelagibacteraceae bacterium]MBT6198372.1 bile acid:sodium symporter family protein [Pelagibacteraceae bacterium]
MNIVTDLILPIALAFIMFSLGLGLSLNDFTRIFLKPKEFIVGFASQLIILPIVALILVLILPASPEIAIGVMILAAAPGGATSNILTSFAKGDVALSISLTAVISILSVVTIPLILGISLSFLGLNLANEGISLMDIALKMFLIVTIPVLIGISLSRVLNSFEDMAKKISTILFFLVLLGAILAERENVVSYFAQAGLITLILNILMMVIAFYLSKALISNSSQQRAITLECGLQNGTLAIVVANVFFDGGAYLIPAATYSLIMYFTALPYIFYLRRN